MVIRPLKGEESLFDRDGLYQIPWFIRVEPLTIAE